jgi:hypothetical protein
MLNREETSRDVNGGLSRWGRPEGLDLEPVQQIPNSILTNDNGHSLNNIKDDEEIGDYYVQEVGKAQTKPYRLPPGDRLKCFPFGYTAWLPFTTEHVGYTRGDLSKVCLRQLDEHMAAVDHFRTSPARTHPPLEILAQSSDRVLNGVPGYTGYKEGTHYRYGYTHGQEMKDPIQKRHPWLTHKSIDSMN